MLFWEHRVLNLPAFWEQILDTQSGPQGFVLDMVEPSQARSSQLIQLASSRIHPHFEQYLLIERTAHETDETKGMRLVVIQSLMVRFKNNSFAALRQAWCLHKHISLRTESEEKRIEPLTNQFQKRALCSAEYTI